VSWTEHFEEKKSQLAIDVIKCGSGKWSSWDVSYRTDEHHCAHDIQHHIASFDTVLAAKRFAIELANAAVRGQPIPEPADFEKYADLAWGFVYENRYQDCIVSLATA
jgi:hypothetical protein